MVNIEPYLTLTLTGHIFALWDGH